MKRKVFEEYVSFPSKSRRLDGELIDTAVDEPRSMEDEVVATTAFQTASETDTQRALVLYNPANIPFLRSPTSPDFNFILNSDLVPGLKGQVGSATSDYSTVGTERPGLLVSAKSRGSLPIGGLMGVNDYLIFPNRITPAEDTNDCSAVVPWVGSQFAQASPTAILRQSDSTELEQVEMMDTEDSTSYNIGGIVKANEGLQFCQQQQQQCIPPPQFLPNKFSHVPW